MEDRIAAKEETEKNQSEKDNEKEKSELIIFLKELPILVITAVILAFLIKTFIVQPFYIPSGSMEPTLYPGDRVLVNKFIYKFKQPSPGDIIVFVPPGDKDKDFIKRIIAIGGQEVEVKNGEVYVNGQTKDEPYIIGMYNSNDYGPERVPLNNVFVMGDNRPNSQDSRVFGPLQKSAIVGKAFMIYWPPQRIRLLR